MSPSYSPLLVAEVARLGAAGWKPSEIQQLLQRRGQAPMPHVETIMRWSNPDAAARHRRTRNRSHATRSAAASGGSLSSRSQRPEMKRARIDALSRCGLDVPQIAAVMRLDFGGAWSHQTIRTVLAGGQPKTWAAIAGEPATGGTPTHRRPPR